MSNEFGIITTIYKELNDVKIEYRRRGVLDIREKQIVPKVTIAPPAPIPVVQNLSLFGGEMISFTETLTDQLHTTLVPCPGFSKVAQITIDRTKVPGVSSQTNFRLLISLTDSRLKHTSFGGFVTNIHGYDIRPYSALCAVLPFELEDGGYDPATGTVLMWTLIPTVNGASGSTDTSILLNWGNSSLTTDGSTAWNEYTSVVHMNAFASDLTRDSVYLPQSSLNEWARNIGGVGGPALTPWMYGNACSFDGIDDYMQWGLAGSAMSPGTQAVTAKIWLQTTAAGVRHVFGKRNGCGGLAFWQFYLNTDGTAGAVFHDHSGGTIQTVNGATDVCDGVKHRIAVTRATTTLSLYVDNFLDAASVSSGTADVQDDGGNSNIGSSGSCSGFYEDTLRDLHVKFGTAHDLNWIKATYNMEFSPSTFYSVVYS